MKKIILLICSISLIFAYVGKISALKGDAYIIRDGKKIAAKIGMQIENKDIVKTQNARLQLIFKDRTIITIGKNSNFNIQDYIFDNKKITANFKLSKGIIKTITGKISKIAPQRFHIKTKNAIIGIRGTIFVVEFQNNMTRMTMVEGVTSFADLSTKQTFEVHQGEQITLNPKAPTRVIIKQVKKIPQVLNNVTKTKKVTTTLIQQVKEVATALAPVKESEVTEISTDLYKIGYKTVNNIPAFSWYSVNLPQAPAEDINDMIDGKVAVSYLGDVLAITDDGVARGKVDFDVNFGTQTWNGQFEFQTNSDNRWHFIAKGDLDTSGFKGNVVNTFVDSTAKDISGDINGKFYKNASYDEEGAELDSTSKVQVVGGNGSLHSSNKGDAKMSFVGSQSMSLVNLSGD